MSKDPQDLFLMFLLKVVRKVSFDLISPSKIWELEVLMMNFSIFLEEPLLQEGTLFKLFKSLELNMSKEFYCMVLLEQEKHLLLGN